MVEYLAQWTQHPLRFVNRHILDMLVGEHFLLLELIAFSVGALEEVVFFELTLVVCVILLLWGSLVVWSVFAFQGLVAENWFADNGRFAAIILTL